MTMALNNSQTTSSYTSIKLHQATSSYTTMATSSYIKLHNNRTLQKQARVFCHITPIIKYNKHSHFTIQYQHIPPLNYITTNKNILKERPPLLKAHNTLANTPSLISTYIQYVTCLNLYTYNKQLFLYRCVPVVLLLNGWWCGDSWWWRT